MNADLDVEIRDLSCILARLVDATGSPVANTPVVFQVARNDGTIAATGVSPRRAISINTDAQGQAQLAWTIGGRAGLGGNLLEASAPGFGGVARFTASGTPGGELHLHADSGTNQTGLVGQPLPQPLVVIVTDGRHNRLGNIPVTFSVLEGGGQVALDLPNGLLLPIFAPKVMRQT